MSIARNEAAKKKEEIPLVHVVHHPERRAAPPPADQTDAAAMERWNHHCRILWMWGSGNWG